MPLLLNHKSNFDKTWCKDAKMWGLKISICKLFSKITFWTREKEVPEKPHGVSDEDAADHHQWGGQPHKVLARGEVHPIDPFQGQNCINKEKVYPTVNTHAVSIYMTGIVPCVFLWDFFAWCPTEYLQFD